MVRILLKIIPYKLFRRFGWPKLLPMSLTIGLTYRCNSKCQTCRVWQKDKGAQELSLEELDKIFQNFERSLVYLTLSGGEPFLRDDLVKICQSAYKHCKPEVITIPTNSLLPKKTLRTISKIAQECPQTQIIINLSVDEIGEKDDTIRGIPGHFQKTMALFQALKKLKYKNLTVGLHTVISKYNEARFPKIASTLLRLQPDSYVTEIAEERKELGTMGMEITPTSKKYSQAIDFLTENLREQQMNGFGKITKAFRLEYYSLVKKILSQKKQIIPCFAGWASAQIAPNGDIWGCCVKADVYGNLRKANYDFAKIWFSQKAESHRTLTRRGYCFCPLANAAYTNMLFHLPTLIKVGLNLAR